MSIKEEALELRDYVVSQRRYMHSHPELSAKEYETTKHITEELRDTGAETITFSDITGVIGIIKGTLPGKTVMLRADIDALPISEPPNKPYSSQNIGVMHACGHDCHAAMLLGAAKLLAAHRSELHGTVKLLFQMGEEIGRSSENYVKNGSLDGTDAIFGMHVWPLIESGKANFEDGERMASSDRFSISIYGKSSPAGMPETGHDSIAAAASVVMALQAIVSRLNSPANSLVISVGMMNGGETEETVACKTELVGTVRTFNREFRQNIPRLIEKTAQNAAAIYACTAELDYAFLPGPVINEHTNLTKTARSAAEKILGKDGLVPFNKVLGAEDFSILMEKTPGVFGFLGTRNEKKGISCSLHHPMFEADEDILPYGAAIYAQFAIDYLNGK